MFLFFRVPPSYATWTPYAADTQHTCLPGYSTQLLLAWALGSRATELDVTQRLALEDLLEAFILLLSAFWCPHRSNFHFGAAVSYYFII